MQNPKKAIKSSLCYNIPMPKVLLIIPAYDEDANILSTCQKIADYNKQHHTDYDFIVINDSSNDSTGQILDASHLSHVDHIYNLGIGGAMQTGYKYARDNDYDIAVQFDGDGQHDINAVETLIQPIKDGEADLVIGSRFLTKTGRFRSTFARRVGIKIISDYMKLLTHRRISDTTSGFRACDRLIIEKFARDYPSEYPEPVTTTACLLQHDRVAEVPVEMNARTAGASSIHTWKKAYYMINVFMTLLVVKIRGRY